MGNLYSTEPGLRTPVYVVDEAALIHNLEILQKVQQRTGCHILLAQKAFSMFRVYPLIGRYLAGATASGLFEARLAHEEMPGRENHVFSPAYTPEEMREIVQNLRPYQLQLAGPAGSPPPHLGGGRRQCGAAGQPGALHPGGPRDL